MLILVSFFKAPSGISMEASPKVTIPPSSAEIRTSDFSSFTETDLFASVSFVTDSANSDNGHKTKIYETIITMATILLVKLTFIVFSVILRMVFLSFLFIFKSNPYWLTRKDFIVCNDNSKS